MNIIFNKLSMARRAGKTVCGFDKVKETVEAGNAFLVLLASDVSEKTKKEVFFFSNDKTEVVPTNATVAEFGDGIGFKTAVVAITDEGFARAIKKVLD